MKIIAIDPGYEKIGIAVLEKEDRRKEKLLFSECFKTLSSLPCPERLANIGKEVSKIISKYKPEAMAIETLFFNTNQKTALHVSEARGVVIYCASSKNIPVYEFTPLQIKIAVTGYGRADKTQVISMVQKLIEIKNEISQDDEYDAIAVGLTFFSCYNTIKARVRER